MLVSPAFQAFTVKYDGTAARIVTPVYVMPAFDPSTPPTTAPAAHQANALWDTGASKSGIAPSVVKALGLTAVGRTPVSHAGGQSVSLTYRVNLRLPNSVSVVGVLVSEFSAIPGGFQCIIGMDIITLGDLSLTNYNGQSCLSFRTPSLHQVDYVADHGRDVSAGCE